MPGVEKVALAGWPLLGGKAWNGFISVNGAPPGPVLAYFLNVSPGWIDTMKIELFEGRDFRPADTSPGAAVVNETFVKQFFNGESPIGKSISKGSLRYEVVGLVHDAPYFNLREPILPVVYVPFHSIDNNGASSPVRRATFIVRTVAADPSSLATTLRLELPRLRPEFRVSNIRTQAEINQSHTVRERLLAALALFFAVVALLLAAVGLYGVLDYSVLQRRREIGIRLALGAQAGDVIRRVTTEAATMIALGAGAGLAAGLASARYLDALLYQVRPTDIQMLAMPAAIIIAAGMLAAFPAVVRALRIDPSTMLRVE